MKNRFSAYLFLTLFLIPQVIIAAPPVAFVDSTPVLEFLEGDTYLQGPMETLQGGIRWEDKAVVEFISVGETRIGFSAMPEPPETPEAPEEAAEEPPEPESMEPEMAEPVVWRLTLGQGQYRVRLLMDAPGLESLELVLSQGTLVVSPGADVYIDFRPGIVESLYVTGAPVVWRSRTGVETRFGDSGRLWNRPDGRTWVLSPHQGDAWLPAWEP